MPIKPFPLNLLSGAERVAKVISSCGEVLSNGAAHSEALFDDIFGFDLKE
jgi:hypothetical protein